MEFSICNTPVVGGYQSGSGTAASPYIICTADQWQKLATTSADWTKAFKLGDSIDFSSVGSASFQSIGSVAVPFSGSLDGDGKALRNLSVTLVGTSLALFGVTQDASFRNLTLSNFTLSSNENVSGLVDTANGSSLTFDNITLSNVTMTASKVGASYAGGLVAYSNATQSNFSRITVNNLTVSETGQSLSVGGLAGYSAAFSISDVTMTSPRFNFLSVTATGAALVGLTNGNVSVSNVNISGLSANPTSGGVPYFSGVLQLHACTSVGGPYTLTLNRVLVQGDINWSTSSGGLVGRVCTGVGSTATMTITESGFNGRIINSGDAGGLVYWHGRGALVIQRSFVKGSLISGDWQGAGGILYQGPGNVADSVTISDAYVAATTVAVNPIRTGVAGIVRSGGSGTLNISRVYVSSAVTGNTANSSRGCFMVSTGGALNSSDNFYDSDTCTLGKAQQSGVMAGVTAQDTATMKPASAFPNWNNGNWVFSAGSYPRLAWE